MFCRTYNHIYIYSIDTSNNYYPSFNSIWEKCPFSLVHQLIVFYLHMFLFWFRKRIQYTFCFLLLMQHHTWWSVYIDKGFILCIYSQKCIYWNATLHSMDKYKRYIEYLSWCILYHNTQHVFWYILSCQRIIFFYGE